MTQQLITIGSADAKAGDTLFSAFTKANANFTELFEALITATVTVINVDDFPTPSAGVITLDDSTLYLVSALVDIGSNTLAFGLNSELRGLNSSLSSITSSSANPLIVANNQSMRISMITLNNPNGDLISFTGSITSSFVMEQVVSFSFQNVGTFNNTFSGTIRTCVFVGGTDGITFTGTGSGQWLIDSTGFNSFSGIALDFGTATFQTIAITTTAFTGLGGSTSISGLTSSGNITTRATIAACTFNGAGTPLSGLLPDDIKYTYTGNFGVRNTRNAGDIFLTGGSETITTGSAGDWQEIGVPGGGGVSWSSDIADRFTAGTDGTLTYIGEADIEATLTGRATVEKSGGGSDVLEVRFAVNWNGTASDEGLDKSRAQTQSADPTTVPIGALTTLSTNDNVRVIFSNTTGTSNIIASVASVEVTG